MVRLGLQAHFDGVEGVFDNLAGDASDAAEGYVLEGFEGWVCGYCCGGLCGPGGGERGVWESRVGWSVHVHVVWVVGVLSLGLLFDHWEWTYEAGAIAGALWELVLKVEA